jgi:hypothetical protein
MHVASAWKRLSPFFEKVFTPAVFGPLLVVTYLAMSFLVLSHEVSSEKGRANLVSGDAGHYLDIGEDLARGNFSMDYVNKRPHRQPLYSATIAPVIAWKGRDLFAMAAVNVFFAGAGLALTYYAVLSLFQSRGVAALAGVLYWTNGFLLEQTTTHLLTEPLHIVLMLAIIFTLLGYLSQGRPWQLVLAAVLTGLDYLTRSNGLFVAIALVCVVLLQDFGRLAKDPAARVWKGIFPRLALYGACVVVVLIVTIPSWLPRLEYYGNALHHGYLSNYLWVDTYKEAHAGGRFPLYTWRDYVANHSLGDAIRRAAWGFWRVAVDLPIIVEKPFFLLAISSIGGAVLALIFGPEKFRLLVLFAGIQLAPLMWTHVSNPNPRVPYASTFPFEILFAALLFSYLAQHLRLFLEGNSPTRRSGWQVWLKHIRACGIPAGRKP